MGAKEKSSIKSFLFLSLALIFLFLLLHLLGSREHVGVLSGTSSASLPQQLLGLLYLFSFVAAVFLSPIFLLAAGSLELWGRLIRSR